MTIAATTIWEFRTTGNNNNGGGFNPSNATAGTDYSQQDAAQDSGTDLACADGDAAAPVVTSASHNFVDADEGNIIQITAGTGFTVGFYEIVSTAGNAATLDRAVGADGALSGGTWAMGGALALPTDGFFENTAKPGNKVWMKAGTYTQTASVAVAADGTAALPITVEGYNSTRGDTPTGTNRPLVTGGAYTFTFDDFWIIKNLRVASTGNGILSADNGSVLFNCKVDGTNVGDASSLASSGNQARIIGCEATSTNGHGFNTGGGSHIILGCYFHDCATKGLNSLNSNSSVIGCVFDTCTNTGADIGASDGVNFINCTFYNCGIGVDFTDASATGNSILNCIFDGCTTGVSGNTGILNNFLDYNVWDNTTDVSNISKGDHDIDGDPALDNPASGSFGITAASNAYNEALDYTTYTSAT